MTCETTTNPVSVPVTQNHRVHLQCVAHAGFSQKVIASFNSDLSSPVATFTGSGENVPMTSGGKNFVSVPTGSNSTLYVKFQYASDGTNFQDAVYVCKPLQAGALTQITSEDFTDNDANDSYFFLIDTGS